MTNNTSLSSGSRAWLKYYRSSLADADLLGFDGKKISRKFPFEAFISGRLSGSIVEELFENCPKDEYVDLVFAPFRASLAVNHGVASYVADRVVFPLWVPAICTRDGELLPSKRISPWMPREHLEPTFRPTILGSLEDYDNFQTGNNNDPSSMTWADTIRFAGDMLEAVMGRKIQPNETITLSGHDYQLDGQARFAEESVLKGASTNILGLCDAILDKSTELPLLSRILPSSPVSSNPQLSLVNELDAAKSHLGQMTCLFPLSPSQRRALHHFFALGDGQILAVNGPPGTGKTTLLQSVIASMVVKAALARDEHPPLIVAVSTNNQAVTNIIQSFSLTADTANNLLTTRWLPDVNSFGLYCPSKNKYTSELLKRFHCCATHRDCAPDFPATLETPEYLSKAEPVFLEEFSTFYRETYPDTPLPEMLTIEAARDLLADCLDAVAHEQGETLEALRDLASRSEALDAELLPRRAEIENQLASAELLDRARSESVQRAREAYEDAAEKARAFKQHALAEPFLWSFLAFLPPVKNRIALRNRAFFDGYAPDANPSSAKPHATREIVDALDQLAHNKHTELKERQAALRMANDTADELGRTLGEIKAEIKATIAAILEIDPQPLPEVADDSRPRLRSNAVYSKLEPLDIHLRTEMWWLAVHYFEASWLLERRSDLDSNYSESKYPAKQLRRWHRYTKLTPCIVTTLHMAPKIFTAYNPKPIPLYEAIDLLILDESGQVSPEVAVPTFALAKKALVVGDVFQINPVWSVPEPVDAANLIAGGLLSRGMDKSHAASIADNPELRLCSASSGSLMNLAQRATPFQLLNFTEPGMHLTEHRRCATPIINYCKALVYPNLEPMTRVRETLMQPFGYAHVAGVSETITGSRVNVIEAETIADWLTRRAQELENHYAQPLSKTVAVITPFAGQARVIRNALEAKGLSGLTVGTVHCLQGSERHIVIFSPTVTTSDSGPYFFDRGPNMLNVAVSRAKDSFLAFGDMGCFDPNDRSHPSGLLGHFLFNLHPSEIVDIAPSRRSFRVKTTVRNITTLESHVAILGEAFTKATDSLLIVSPCLTRKVLEADEIASKVRKAVSRGVDVQVFTDPDFNRDDRHISYMDAISMLREAGATVTECRRIHNKTIMMDTVMLVDGSFNWLSASREQKWARHERSIAYTSNDLSDAKNELLEHMVSRAVLTV